MKFAAVFVFIILIFICLIFLNVFTLVKDYIIPNKCVLNRLYKLEYVDAIANLLIWNLVTFVEQSF